jgi:hypothetical protein
MTDVKVVLKRTGTSLCGGINKYLLYFCVVFMSQFWKMITSLRVKKQIQRMLSSGMLRRVALVRTDVSEESGASFIRATRIGELGTTQAATNNRRTLRRNIKIVCFDE